MHNPVGSLGEPLYRQLRHQFIQALQIYKPPEVPLCKCWSGSGHRWRYNLTGPESGRCCPHGSRHTKAQGFVDYATQQANAGAESVIGTIDTSIGQLEADRRNRQGALDAQKLTYGGPQSAKDLPGVNELEKANLNVKNVATNFAGDRATQQAGLQQKYRYGSGFAALDGFLGRQDGRNQINAWAGGVQPGSSQATYDKANAAIDGAKGRVNDAQGRLSQALKDNAALLSVPVGTNVPVLPDHLQPNAPKHGGAAPTGMKGYVDTTLGTAIPVRPKTPAATQTGFGGFSGIEDEYLQKERKRRI